jgi:hypothetical protein
LDILEATAGYEAWLGRFMTLVPADIAEKHGRMRAALFPFMRATYYRWCTLWREGAGRLAGARRVLAVGDLHLENFGTWRDAEGRLIWGINDFDEATALPWTQDLVRLATSAHLAIGEGHVGLARRSACEAILRGYVDGLDSGGKPFVLEEEHDWLREVATSELRRADVFWEKLDALPGARTIDATARTALTAALPTPAGTPIRFARRVAGMGSLGRPRVVGIATWGGGRVAREAKAVAPSAWSWATGRADDASPYARVLERAVRVPDPTVRVDGAWLLRRLGPHCTRIELSDLPDAHDEEQLLHAMGFETANIHLGTRDAARAIRAELRALAPRWLHGMAKTLASAVTADWARWREALRTRAVPRDRARAASR